MCHLTPTDRFLHQAIPNGCAAKTLGPGQRLTLGLQGLAGQQNITHLAYEFDVSRKFVYSKSPPPRAPWRNQHWLDLNHADFRSLARMEKKKADNGFRCQPERLR